MNKYQQNRITEEKFLTEEKKKLIKGLFKSDPVKYYPARLARIFRLTRQRIDQILKDKE